MAEPAAVTGEQQYNDFDRALLAGALYKTETHMCRYDCGTIVPVPVTYPPTLLALNYHMPRLIAERDRRWAETVAVAEYRIAVSTRMVDGTRKEPLYPGSYVLVNRPCKVPLYTPVIIRKGAEEDAGLYWSDPSNYGLTIRDMIQYEEIAARIAQIHTECGNGNTRDERRELHYMELLGLAKDYYDNEIVRKHKAWLRRRHAIAAMARFSAPPAAPEPVVKVGRVGEW